MRAHVSATSRPTVKLPNFVRVQRDGWDQFLRGEQIHHWSLTGAFKRNFPVTDPGETFTLDFVRCVVGKPVHNEAYCLRHGVTYEAALTVTLRLVQWSDSEPRAVKEVLEKSVSLGRIPLMTSKGQFVLNGSYWTILAQLQKSPGLYIREPDKGDPVTARIVTEHGSWSSLIVDKGRKKVGLGIRFDKRAPINFVTFLRACGLTLDHIISSIAVGESEIEFDGTNWLVPRRGHPITNSLKKKLDKGQLKDRTLDKVPLTTDAMECVISTGYIFDRSGQPILTPGKLLSDIVGSPVPGVYKAALLEKNTPLCTSAYQDLSVDNTTAALTISQQMIPGSAMSAVEARQHVSRLVRQQIIGTVGRHRMELRFGTPGPINMTSEDYIRIGRHFAEILTGHSKVNTYTSCGREVALAYDDMEDYANRRLRVSGEVVGRYVNLLVTQMVRNNVRSNMHKLASEDQTELPDIGALFPGTRLAHSIRTFFATEQLVQHTDDLNPIAEIEHKRRVTALGQGGLKRDAAKQKVRDVHTTQFGRVCPISTPEGQNVGLVSSLALFAKVQTVDGLIASPLENVKTGDVQWISADKETASMNIAVYQQPLDEGRVVVRTDGSLASINPEDVTHREVHPSQAISAASALIPFMGHDDANRALMGSNMQRQAVPLIRPEAPIVGTGIESTICRHASRNVVSEVYGKVSSVDSTFIIVEVDGRAGKIPADEDNSFIVHQLAVCESTNSDVALRQTPTVKVGDRVKPGQIIADGPASANGELALGKNLVAAYLPWRGYNFEDAFVVSSRVIEDDTFTSIHTAEFGCEARIMAGSDKKEEITIDVGALSNADRARLDENGIVQVGSFVKMGDILVSKIAPRMDKDGDEADVASVLMAALFNSQKAAESVRFVPLVVPEGVAGVVTNVKVVESDPGHKTITVTQDRELDLIERRCDKLVAAITARRDELLAEAEFSVQQSVISAWAKKALSDAEARCSLERDTLVPANMEAGVLKMVVITIASREVLQVGDKLALRHGNKGVVSIIVPQEEMPHLADGTPVDVLINPLGVPSRMNIGQLYEAHLGYGLLMLGRKVANYAKARAKPSTLLSILRPVFKHDKSGTQHLQKLALTDPSGLRRLCIGYERGIPVATSSFQGVSYDDIKEILRAAGCASDGQADVFDGRTGEVFENRITVGLMYVLKLHHMVAHKMHARSTGPYSLITQQPLGGKSHTGGQRLGEMEVWALEAYGAAYCLQEMLTLKSDDLHGRNLAFKEIVTGKPVSPGKMPASTSLMLMELRGLGLDVELVEDKGSKSKKQRKIKRR